MVGNRASGDLERQHQSFDRREGEPVGAEPFLGHEDVDRRVGSEARAVVRRARRGLVDAAASEAAEESEDREADCQQYEEDDEAAHRPASADGDSQQILDVEQPDRAPRRVDHGELVDLVLVEDPRGLGRERVGADGLRFLGHHRVDRIAEEGAAALEEEAAQVAVGEDSQQ